MTHRQSQYTTPGLDEREVQILDGLRWADALLFAFGFRPKHIDVAALVTLRTLQWVDPSMTVGEAVALLSTIDPKVDSFRKVS